MRACWSAALAVVALGLLPAVGGAETEFAFPSLDGTHRFSEVAASPVTRGPFQVHFRVKTGELRVLSHRLYLSPLADGTHRAHLAARVEGMGTVAAEVTALGFSTDQADVVTLPPQDQSLVGRLTIDRVGDVYRVRTVELPPRATVRIQSGLGEKLTERCEEVPLVEALGGDCAGLRRAVSAVTFELPQPGEVYEIRRDALTEGERNALDRYLGETSRRR